MEALPEDGKFLTLNMSRRHGEVYISTITVRDDMSAELRMDYLKDCLCWDYFPATDLEIEEDPEDNDGSGKKAVSAA